MKIVAIVQARMGSTRLPDKVMKEINGVPMIELLLARLSKSKELDQIVVATSFDEKNKPLMDHIFSCGYACEQGSETDVLERYLITAKKYQADVIVESELLLELKARKTLDKNCESQLLNYLNASNLQTGLLINFGSKSLQFKRMTIA